MNFSLTQLITFTIVSLLLGLLLGFLGGVYFLKKQAKKLQKQLESMDREQIKSMSSAFGRNLSEEQINKVMNTIEGLKKKKKEPKKKK